MGEAIHQAAREGAVEKLSQLLADGAPTDGREREPPEKIPSMLLSQGEETVLAAGFSFARTPLMLAALGGHLAAVEMLLGAGAGLTIKDAAGWTAFTLACRHGHVDVASALQARGADLKQRGPGKRTALHLASEEGHLEMLEWLLERGVQVDLKDASGQTALLLAALSGQLAALPILLKRGADANLASRDGRTPLATVLLATERRQIPEAEAFRGGYVSVQWTDHGVFALVPMAEERLLPLVGQLLEAGAEVNPATPFTPLAAAAQAGHAGLVQLLLSSGADANALSITGDTPLELARLLKHDKVVALLEGCTSAGPSRVEDKEEDLSRWGPDLPVPAFGKVSPGFRQAVDDLALQLGGAEVRSASDCPGAFELLVPQQWDWPQSLETLQAAYLSRQVFVFEPGTHSAHPHRLLALPTSDRGQALLVLGTSGCGVGPGYLVEWLENLESRQPLALLAVGHDMLAGRFLTPLSDPAALAQEMFELCPDIVDQGCDTVEELAEELAETGRFFLWWD